MLTLLKSSIHYQYILYMDILIIYPLHRRVNEYKINFVYSYVINHTEEYMAKRNTLTPRNTRLG